MTTATFLSYLIMPAAGLAIGGIVLWLVSRDAIKADPTRR